MKIFADLHIHTTYSDGRDSPAEVVRAAARIGLGAVAITDHDCVAGADEAVREGARLGVEVVPGVELTAYGGPVEVHVLGYFMDYRDGAFLRLLKARREERVERLCKMLEKLESMGIAIGIERVMAVAGGGAIGRPHLARVLVDERHASSVRAAFARFIGNRAPAYVPRERVAPREAIRIIKRARGIAVLAHPCDLEESGLIPALVADGIEGIEVYYSAHTPRDENRCRAIAGKHGLLIVGGSDYHGSMKGESVSIGDRGIDRRLYDDLLEYRADAARRSTAGSWGLEKSER